jgi:hypothetical protein
LRRFINALTPELAFGDSFAEADTTNLGSQWSERAGDLIVQGNQVIAKGTGANIGVYSWASLSNVEVQAQINVPGFGNTSAGLVARYTGSVAGFHANLAEAFRATGQLDRALGSCQLAIQLNPSDPTLFSTGTLPRRFQSYAGNRWGKPSFETYLFDLAGKVSSLAGGTPSASAIRPMLISDGFRSPRSMPPT